MVWSEVQTCIRPADATANSLSLASAVKSRLVLPFRYRLIWVVLEKGPLNVCVCVYHAALDLCRWCTICLRYLFFFRIAYAYWNYSSRWIVTCSTWNGVGMRAAISWISSRNMIAFSQFTRYIKHSTGWAKWILNRFWKINELSKTDLWMNTKREKNPHCF